MKMDYDFVNKAREKIPILCVDGVVINEEGAVLLTRRETEPFKGYWHLPGGLLRKGERVEEGVVRVVREETGLVVKIVGLVGVFSDPKRDPRGHFVTVAFELRVVGGKLKGDFQSSELRFFDELPEEMGFDAGEIVERVRQKESGKRKLKKIIRLVGVLVFNDEKEFLLIHRKKSKDQWEVPGGKVKIGETDEVAAIRELEEEIGIKVVLKDKIGESEFEEEGKGFYYVWYRGIINNKNVDIRLEEGFDGYKYADSEWLEQMRDKLSWGTKKLLELEKRGKIRIW